jgi:hypothetical protein
MSPQSSQAASATGTRTGQDCEVQWRYYLCRARTKLSSNWAGVLSILLASPIACSNALPELSSRPSSFAALRNFADCSGSVRVILGFFFFGGQKDYRNSIGTCG